MMDSDFECCRKSDRWFLDYDKTFLGMLPVSSTVFFILEFS